MIRARRRPYDCGVGYINSNANGPKKYRPELAGACGVSVSTPCNCVADQVLNVDHRTWNSRSLCI
jgi:hypothetical protein